MKIEGHPGWNRHGGTLINSDNEAYELYKLRRKKKKEESNKLIELENRIKNLEEKLDAAIRTIENQR